jgi:predicted ATP-binding protein involved in virulence
MVRQLPAKIELSADWGDSNLPMKMMPQTWTRYRESERPKTKTRSDELALNVSKRAGSLQKLVRNPKADPIDLPVFGYYGTGRLWAQKKLTEHKNSKQDDTAGDDFDIRTFAYRNCMDPASSYKHFREWFIIAWRNRANMVYLSSPTEQEVRQAKERVEVVQQAINTFLKETTGWHSLEVIENKQEAELFLNHPEQGRLSVDQLSDGIRGVLAMVGDLAHRCVKLNRHLGNKAATDTSGVVLIDEVDMHLHPRWQQVVLGQLQEAFPNIQFIVTTHSPQVLSTVRKENIRILGKNADGQDVAGTPPAHSYGEPSNRVLQGVMRVDPQPPVNEKADLERLTALAEQGLYTEHEAQQLLAQLKEKLSPNHPQLQRIERSIRRQEALGR